jgi:hypothetical protein
MTTVQYLGIAGIIVTLVLAWIMIRQARKERK